jgi:predicted KAP-like P-loop ATPase
MLISLHRQATTTPRISAAIQASHEPAWIVVESYGISEQTVWDGNLISYDNSPVYC